MNKVAKSVVTLGLGLLTYATPQVAFGQNADSTATETPAKKLTNREKRKLAYAQQVAEDKEDVICTVEKLITKMALNGSAITYSPVNKNLVITNQYLTIDPELLKNEKGRPYKGPPVTSNIVVNLEEKTILRLIHQGQNHIIAGRITEEEFTPACKQLFADALNTDMGGKRKRLASNPALHHTPNN